MSSPQCMDRRIDGDGSAVVVAVTIFTNDVAPAETKGGARTRRGFGDAALQNRQHHPVRPSSLSLTDGGTEIWGCERQMAMWRIEISIFQLKLSSCVVLCSFRFCTAAIKTSATPKIDAMRLDMVERFTCVCLYPQHNFTSMH